MRELNLSLSIAKLIEHLAQMGVTFKASSNFRQFQEVAKQVRRKAVSPEFDGTKFDYHPETGLWTSAWHDGEPISIHATRYENIGRQSLSKHLKNQQPRLYDGKVKHCCKLMKKMRGSVSYSGEFELVDDWKGQDITGVLVILNFLLTFQRWRDLNWIWGLMDEELAKRGKFAAMGFTHAIPMGVIWEVEPKQVSNNDWLVAVPARDMENWAAIIAKRGPEPLLKL